MYVDWDVFAISQTYPPPPLLVINTLGVRRRRPHNMIV